MSIQLNLSIINSGYLGTLESKDFSKFLIKYNLHSAKLIAALIGNIESAPF